MKLNYYADTDSLYIDLSERLSVESKEISEGVVLDYDADGNLVGIDIDHASLKVDMKKITLNKLSRQLSRLILYSFHCYYAIIHAGNFGEFRPDLSKFRIGISLRSLAH